jgi:hypothetical protein
MFRALRAHPQDSLHKRHLLYCVRIMSVGCVTVPQPTDIIRTQYTKCRLCRTSWGWASNTRNMYRPLILNKLNEKCITLVSRWTTRAEPEDHLWSADHSLGNAGLEASGFHIQILVTSLSFGILSTWPNHIIIICDLINLLYCFDGLVHPILHWFWFSTGHLIVWLVQRCSSIFSFQI